MAEPASRLHPQYPGLAAGPLSPGLAAGFAVKLGGIRLSAT